MSIIAITCTSLGDSMPPGLWSEASLPPPFNAADYGTLLRWYDADDASTITESGGSVSQWDDKSANTDHAEQSTGANQPAYNATGINSRGAINFGTFNDALFLKSTKNMGLSGDFESTAFAVVRSTYDGLINAFPTVFMQNERSNSRSYGLALADERATLVTWNDHSSVAAGAAIDTTNPHLICLEKAAGTLTAGTTFYIDGGSALSTTITNGSNNTPNLIDAPLLIGRFAESIGFHFFQGDIGEIIIYDGVLSAADRNAVTDHLIEKWGIS